MKLNSNLLNKLILEALEEAACNKDLEEAHCNSKRDDDEEEDEDAALEREVREMGKEVAEIVQDAKKLNKDAGVFSGLADQFKKLGKKEK